MAILISADDLKAKIPGYDPADSGAVHRESTRLADRHFAQALKYETFDRVILMSGGGASGKTEFVVNYLSDDSALIFDGTLPSLEGARNKVREAQKAGKPVTVYAVWPEDFKIAFAAFLGRDRKYADEYFYLTHSKSRAALLQIVESNLVVDIHLVESQYDKGNARLLFYEIGFKNRDDLIEYIRLEQYTEDEIQQIVLGQS